MSDTSGHSERPVRPVIARGLATDKGSVQPIPAGGSPGFSGQATIQVHKEGNVVQWIMVRCGCGELTRVECRYE